MNTETRVRGVHSSRPGGYTHNDAPAAYHHDQGLRGDAPGEIDSALIDEPLLNVLARSTAAGAPKQNHES